MIETVNRALTLWGLDDACVHLAAARENAVYKVTTPQKAFALRLHRRGYRSDAELKSELAWMRAMTDGGLSVPAPVTSKQGAHLHIVDGIQVDMLTWLGGDTVDTQLPTLDAASRVELFRKLGHQMARLHTLSDAWTPPSSFQRRSWDRDGLLGDAPLWDRFWDNPDLTNNARALFIAFRHKANADLLGIAQSLDFGLIHADLVAANVMVEDGQLHLIDFDDGGYGFRLFDIATALLKHRAMPNYEDIKSTLIASYQEIRPIDTSALDLFLALRAMTYVGWNITRMNEDNNATARNDRFIETAKTLAVCYLET